MCNFNNNNKGERKKNCYLLIKIMGFFYIILAVVLQTYTQTALEYTSEKYRQWYAAETRVTTSYTRTHRRRIQNGSLNQI